MANYASSVSTDPKVEAPDDAALLHLLDGYYIKRHSVNPWNTSGAFCDVFTGDHPTFGKVALKRPRGGRCDDSSLRNFRREARVWKRLQHPHILQFVGIIDTSSYVWLVSVFAEHGTLREYISTHQKADRHSLVLQFTSGLAYLHSEKVVHGDLKADNLLISANHYLLIADFGLSKLNGMSTYASKKGAGSLRWMAPELLEEEDAVKTPSSDVYAYGITISEILGGELPFKQYKTISAVIKAVLGNKRPAVPEESAQGNPYANLWAAARDCWNEESSKRPTMVDIYHRLSQDYTKPVGSAAPSGSTNSNETSHGSGLTEVASASPERMASRQGFDFDPQSMNSITSLSEINDNRLLQLLGNAEHGDIGYMMDDGLCLKGTRVEILDRLDAWATGHQSPKIMLLKGQAGRGKSTIARSVSSNHRMRWGTNVSSAIFHFRRGHEGLNTRLLLALARQLACSANQTVRTAILKSIQGHEDVAQLRLEEQFEVLFVQPLKELGPNSPQILLVVDALDECSDRLLISALFRLIRKHTPSLPSTLKFLFTSRPEEYIVGPFKAFSDGAQEDLDAVALALIDRDVRSYFTTRLSEIQEEYEFDADWVPPKAINELVSLSQGLFQWAHAAMEYVRERPRLNLRRLIGSPNNLLGLPALYNQILSTAFPLRNDIQKDSNFLGLIHHVIGSLVVAHYPMSPVVLEYLWDNVSGGSPIPYPAEEIQDGILGRLGSILTLPSTPNGPIHFMHASVRDFFTKPDQCEDKRFLVDPSVHHIRLAVICFDRMKRDLKQGIHSINDASKAEAEAVDLTEQHLPPGLRYCCRSWSSHLEETSGDGRGYFDHVQQLLQAFCAERLPHWVECLSLTGVLSETFDMIRQTTKWLEITKAPQSPASIPATTLLIDTNDLCRQFFKHMSTYPRLIALSYLLQFPSETALREVYAHSIGQQAPRVVRGPALKRFDWSRVIRGGRAVLCVAFSPDGKTLAFGMTDRTIRLWNMDTGEPMEFNPLVGHKGAVNGLVFSPDSKTLATGSGDSTIRLWNPDTGEPKGMPLIGHKDEVTSIAYSPDGKTLVSGSRDETIQLWNMTKNEPTATSHFDCQRRVTSVAYSPDGKCIASGLSDRRIQLLAVDSGTGKLKDTRLIGSDHEVLCAAFSADGKILALGSYRRIGLWNMDTRQLMQWLPVGHEGSINGLAFSPDSKTLASGSDDTTIRLWDMDTGEPKGMPLIGHKDEVTSIAYSPDGNTLASGSADMTLRSWVVDNGSGEPTRSPLVGHKGRIRSVAYSSSNKTLASGSEDHQIRLWNMDTGKQKRKPLAGHKSWVTRVAFSSNGNTLASHSADGTTWLWAVATGMRQGTSSSSALPLIRASSIALSPRRKILQSGWDDSQIRVWDVVNGADWKDESPHDVPSVHLDLDAPEAYEKGWIFVRGKRCFWLPPEFYLDQDNHKVDMSLFGGRYLVFHHPNIHILDISTFV